jgi:hypothetical protein
MTSISSAAASMTQFASPRERLQDTLETQAANGTVKSDDVQALSAALDDIDAAMTQGRGASGASRGQRPSPTEMTDKINGLIDDQVKSGKLTSDQAEELKGVFADAMPSGGPGGGRGPGGPGGAGGPPPGGPPPGGGPGGACGAEQSSDSSSSSDSSDQLADLLADFLKMVQESQSKSQTYGANGTSSNQISSVSLVVNFES